MESTLSFQRARLADAERSLKTEIDAEKKKHHKKKALEARAIEAVAKSKTSDPKKIMKALDMPTL